MNLWAVWWEQTASKSPASSARLRGSPWSAGAELAVLRCWVGMESPGHLGINREDVSEQGQCRPETRPPEGKWKQSTRVARKEAVPRGSWVPSHPIPVRQAPTSQGCALGLGFGCDGPASVRPARLKAAARVAGKMHEIPQRFREVTRKTTTRGNKISDWKGNTARRLSLVPFSSPLAFADLCTAQHWWLRKRQEGLWGWRDPKLSGVPGQAGLAGGGQGLGRSLISTAEPEGYTQGRRWASRSPKRHRLLPSLNHAQSQYWARAWVLNTQGKPSLEEVASSRHGNDLSYYDSMVRVQS